MNKKLVSILLSCFILFSFSTISFAAGDINQDGGSASIPLDLTINAATFSATVPSSLPINLMPDGTVEVADNAVITNSSAGKISVTDITVEVDAAWELAPMSDDFSTKNVNSRVFGISINGIDAYNGNLIDGFKDIPAGGSHEFTYDVKLAPQSNNSSSITLGYVIVTMGWAETQITEGLVNIVDAEDGSTYSFNATDGMLWQEVVDEGYALDDWLTFEGVWQASDGKYILLANATHMGDPYGLILDSPTISVGETYSLECVMNYFINFSIDGESFRAIDGMNYLDFVNSSLNETNERDETPTGAVFSTSQEYGAQVGVEAKLINGQDYCWWVP